MTNNSQPDFEAAITQALELRRDPVIPAGFAARVMQSLPAQKPVTPRLQVGRTIGIIAAAVLMAGMFALAPHATPNFTSLTFDVELLLLAELGALSYWLTARREA